MRLFILLIFSLNINSQNLKDSIGRKQGKWEWKSSINNSKDDTIYTANFKDDKLNGLLSVLYRGNLIYQRNYSLNYKNGIEICYNNSGSIVLLRIYEMDTLVYYATVYSNRVNDELIKINHQNEWLNRVYYPSGKIRIQSFYKNGAINGLETVYRRNGKIRSITVYKMDEVIEFRKKGKIKNR